MNYRDLGSFTSAYDFELGKKVKIDGCVKGTVLKKKKRHWVMLGGNDIIITFKAE